jgi:hypothetical protein
MSDFDDDARLEAVTDRDGRAARDYLIKEARARGWHLRCGGTAVPHIQFRRTADERPYAHSLILNPVTPTFYVRRPTDVERPELRSSFDGAHENNSGEIKIPVPNQRVAERVAARFFR